MRTFYLLAPAFLAMLFAAPAAAQPKVVIYRCTAADGSVTVQNDKPCPKGSKQEKKAMEVANPPTVRPLKPSTPQAVVPAAPAMPTPAPSSTAPPVSTPTFPAPGQGLSTPVPTMPSAPYSAPATQTVPPSTQRVPAPTTAAAPPATSADRAPPPALFECRTYDNGRYLSENGGPAPRCAPLQTTGVGGTAPPAGESCQMVADTCQPVAAASLCDSWRQHKRELESAISFGRVDNRESASEELDRANTVVRDSTCGL